MRTSGLLLLLLLSSPGWAAWTGMAAFVGQRDSDWRLSGAERQMSSHYYGLHIEEKSQTELRVGASGGQFSVRLLNPLEPSAAERFDGRFISLYLRLPQRLSSTLGLQALLSYRYNRGERFAEPVTDGLISQLSWNELDLELSLSLQLGLLSLRPYISLSAIDGDVASSAALRIIERDESLSRGLKLDYSVERSAYVRFQASSGATQVMQISFVREY